MKINNANNKDTIKIDKLQTYQIFQICDKFYYWHCLLLF